MLKTLAGGAIGAIAAAIGTEEVGEASRQRSAGNACRSNADCASGLCVTESRTRKICHCVSEADCPQPSTEDCRAATCSSGVCGITPGCVEGELCLDGGICCRPDDPSITCDGQCEMTPNNCGQLVDCGPCCTPDNEAACAGLICGTAVNNCGQTVPCGTLCPSGQSCVNGTVCCDSDHVCNDNSGVAVCCANSCLVGVCCPCGFKGDPVCQQCVVDASSAPFQAECQTYCGAGICTDTGCQYP